MRNNYTLISNDIYDNILKKSEKKHIETFKNVKRKKF